MPPFLKWAGSKRDSVDLLLSHLPSTFGNYHEPFLGAGALLFGLLDSGRLGESQVAFCADTCWQLVSMWRAVREEPLEVLRAYDVHVTNHSEDYYYRQRVRWMSLEPEPVIAAWFLYINRAGFNGLWRVNAQGDCNVPWGKRSVESLDITRAVTAASASLRTCSVRVRRAPFEQSLMHVQPGDLVYLDPPFWPRKAGGFVGYGKDGFGPVEHALLAAEARRLRDLGAHVLVSNHDLPEVRALYDDWTAIETSTRRPVNSDGADRGAVPEVLFVGEASVNDFERETRREVSDEPR